MMWGYEKMQCFKLTHFKYIWGIYNQALFAMDLSAIDFLDMCMVFDSNFIMYKQLSN